MFRAALAPGDIPTITDYSSQAIITSMDYGRQVAQFATDDLRACLPAPASADGTPPPAAPPVQYVASQSPAQLAPLAPAGGGSTSSGGTAPAPAQGNGLLVVGLVALVGYGGYLAWRDSKKPAGAMGALPSGKSWLPRDLGPKAAEFDRLNRRAQKTGVEDGRKAAKDVECIPTPTTKRSFSMDEWGGPGAEKLNAAIVRLSEQVTDSSRDLSKLRHDVEHELEDTYFQAYTKSLRSHGAKAGSCE